MTRTFLQTILLTLGLSTAAQADSQAIRMGTVPAADQLGHVFFSFCRPGNLALMERSFETGIAAFGWEQADLGTDLGAISPMDAITVTLDGNPIKQACMMAMHPDIAGDGAALYDGLESHLGELLDGELPTAEAIDGGLRWSFSRSGADFTLEFVMGEGVSITLTGEG